MPSEVAVRDARDDDLSAVRALLEALDDLQRDWRVFPPRPGFREDLIAGYLRAIAEGRGRLVVAEVSGRVVGTAFGREHRPSRFSDQPSLEVSGVVVEQGMRGRGVGRALIRALAEFARERGLPTLDLHTFVQNEPALRLWESLGFRPRYVQLVAALDEVDARLR